MNKSELIYVIEDEGDIAELIRFNLMLNNYQVETFRTGEAALQVMKSRRPNLVVLDLMLPGLSGLEVCRRLQRDYSSRVPIIMVTAKGEEDDIVKGLESGADDYITKPFSPKVLLARVAAVLRRRNPQKKDIYQQLEQAGIKINPGRFEVLVQNEKVDLTKSEFGILHFLAQRPGWVYTRSQIVEAIRGDNFSVTDRTIDFQMVGLRKKLGPVGSLVETERGVGYRFKDI